MHSETSGLLAVRKPTKHAIDTKRVPSACGGSLRELLQRKARPDAKYAGSMARARFPERRGSGRNRPPPEFHARSRFHPARRLREHESPPICPRPAAARRPHSKSREKPGKHLRADPQTKPFLLRAGPGRFSVRSRILRPARQRLVSGSSESPGSSAPPPRPSAHQARRSRPKERESGTLASPLPQTILHAPASRPRSSPSNLSAREALGEQFPSGPPGWPPR